MELSPRPFNFFGNPEAAALKPFHVMLQYSGNTLRQNFPSWPVFGQSRSSQEVGPSRVAQVRLPDHDPRISCPVKRFRVAGKRQAGKRRRDASPVLPTPKRKNRGIRWMLHPTFFLV